MTPLILEIYILSILLIITVALIVFRSFFKNKNIIHIALAILSLIDAFILIHMFFCYQVGFPASIMQNQSTDLIITASDWLSFLGSYLGFAGSLVMAFLVYRQSNIIAELTLSEYIPSTSLTIIECANSCEFKDYEEGFIESSIIQNIPGKPDEPYYSFHCILNEKGNIETEEYINLLFVEITNNSKLTISNLSFLSIEIVSIRNNVKSFTYSKKCGNWDPADGITDIPPGSKLKRCFILESIPKEIDISWMIIKFSYGEHSHFENRILVSKSKDKALTFLNISE